MGVRVMGLGLAAKGGPGTAWLEVVEKLEGNADVFAEKGSTGIEQGCIRLKRHAYQRSRGWFVSAFYSLWPG